MLEINYKNQVRLMNPGRFAPKPLPPLVVSPSRRLNGPDSANGRASASGAGVVGSIPGRAIPKALKMVPVATLLGAQHYKASTGSPLTQSKSESFSSFWLGMLK